MPPRGHLRKLNVASRLLLSGACLALFGCHSRVVAPDLPPSLTVTKILAFGDSLTEGDATPSGVIPFFVHPTNDPGPTKGYPYKLLTLLNQRYTTQSIMVYNGGYGGRFVSDDATGQPDRTLDEFLNAFNPNVMILMHGANDINQETTPLPDVNAVAGFAGQLVAKAQSRGVSVIVSGLPPRMTGGTPNRAKNPQLVVPYNNALAAMAAQKKVRYIDIYGLITQNLAGPDIAPDGLHLTQAGNDKLAAAYFGLLKQFYEISR